MGVSPPVLGRVDSDSPEDVKIVFTLKNKLFLKVEKTGCTECCIFLAVGVRLFFWFAKTTSAACRSNYRAFFRMSQAIALRKAKFP
jgi:hypothetical protein